MNDQNEKLEPGVLGRLAILTGEMRSMRTAAEQLGEGANALTEEVRRQGDRLDELTAIIHVLADGISEVHAMLVRPPLPLPKLPQEHPPTSGRKPSTKSDLLDPVTATVATVVVTAADDPAPSSSEPSSPSSDISGDGGSSGGGGSDSSF
ncbi:MAG: hypothetical protein EHM67_00135 [Hyphomicrobiaceae bacterium]|nr:MAG: hypothetical protein EHM67_00135 [Hyphomicrobiaceae bacterium]